MRPEKKRILILTVLVTIGLCIFFGLRSHDLQENRKKADKENGKSLTVNQNRPPGVEFQSLKLSGIHKGIKQWEILAESVDTNDETHIAKVTNLKRIVLYRNGKPYLSGSAGYAECNMESYDVTVHDKIKLSSDKGDKFRTDIVQWTSASQFLNIPGSVDMVLDGRRISADRAQADLVTETVIAEGNVKVVDEDGKMAGRRLQYSMKDESFALEGDGEIELNL